MIKVLLYQDTILKYRVPIFEKLGEYVDLTVACTSDNYITGRNYKVRRIKKRKVPKIGYINSFNMYGLLKNTDVLISMCTPRYLDIDIVKKVFHKIKHIRWGIGVPAGYDIRFDSPIDEKAYYKMVKNCDAALFYSDYPVRKYSKLGIPTEKMFVANNTVEVDAINTEKTKNKLIFVGNLYKQKRVDLLISEYAKAYRINNNIPDLIIIGDGDQKAALIEQARNSKIEKKVCFMGKIEDEKKLSELFSESIACISPDQAGLTVLKSMGYGVPFVTMRNAITGGEIFNIHDKENGILMDDISELSKIILDSCDNKALFIEYGNNAYSYYQKYRNPKLMVKGFLDAINYVMEKC